MDTTNELCKTCNAKEDTEHFLLLCRSYSFPRSTLLQKVSDIVGFEVSTLPRRRMVDILLYGKEGITDQNNNLILTHVIEYIINTKRLDIYWEEGGV